MSGGPGLCSAPKKPLSASIPTTKGVPGLSGLADPFEMDEEKIAGNAQRGVEARRQAMLDRVSAFWFRSFFCYAVFNEPLIDG